MRTNRQFDVPILFIIFRRKNTALQVIEAIAKVKPKKLYISQDGPRNQEEKQEVLETRKAVLSKINWDCDLTVWTHDQNLGLRKHIPGALDRFFKKEEYGIYLEDDTVPNKYFFSYQKDLLDKYKNDKNIFSISGTNLYPKFSNKDNLYYLSQIGSVWGMGTWRRSWNKYSSKIQSLKNFNYAEYKNFVFSRKYFIYIKLFLNLVKSNKINTWDYQYSYTAIKNRIFFITPSINLVKNIGINNKGTNMFLQNYNSKYSKVSGNQLSNPASNDQIYVKDNDIDYFNRFYKYFYLRIFLNIIFYLFPESLRRSITKLFFR
ncbi:MAG: Methyltransferase FkbM [uncultured bacterium]|nr:MAG: Methyltransferase FkbM [uncultured bacterium]